jgi:LysM repeat protein
VAAGENLYRIGLKYGISWAAIANANNLANPNVLRVGQVLTLPGSTNPGPTPSPGTETTYIVQAGDNLYRIGLRFGVSWVQIAEANGLVNPNMISVGDELKIPVDTPGPAPAFSHVVKRGETLFLISLQYGVSWPAIAEANNLTSPYVIYVGQTLEIPGR